MCIGLLTLVPLAFELMGSKAFGRAKLEGRSSLSWAQSFLSLIEMDDFVTYGFLEKAEKL